MSNLFNGFRCHISSINREIKEIKHELRALKKFISEVEEIEPQINSPSEQILQPTRYDLSKCENKIVQAYKNTIMELDHYDREYGNHWKIDLKEEFGSDIASYIICLNYVTPNMKNMAIKAAIDSREQRYHTLSIFKKEKNLLRDYRSRLQTIESNIGLASDERRWNHLVNQVDSPDEVLEKCEDIIEQRQFEIRQHNKSTKYLDNGEIESYLYSNCDCTYPVLNTAVDYIKYIKNMSNDETAT